MLETLRVTIRREFDFVYTHHLRLLLASNDGGHDNCPPPTPCILRLSIRLPAFFFIPIAECLRSVTKLPWRIHHEHLFS